MAKELLCGCSKMHLHTTFANLAKTMAWSIAPRRGVTTMIITGKRLGRRNGPNSSRAELSICEQHSGKISGGQQTSYGGRL